MSRRAFSSNSPGNTFTSSSPRESYNRSRSFPFSSHDGWGRKIMQKQPAQGLPTPDSAPCAASKPRLRASAIALLSLALLAPTGLVWAHPGGGGGGGHASAGGGGGHESPGGGAHFSGGGHFSGGTGGPHFASPAPHFGSPAPHFNSSAPRWNGSVSRGYVNRTPSYGSAYRGSHGTVTARAGNPHAPIDYGRFAVGRSGGSGGAYRHHWDGGYWHGHYWPPVYYRPDFAWFLPVLPPYCLTYWWGGVPYYYYNEAYYTWDPSDGGYMATEPPPSADDAAADQGPAPAYPDAAPPNDGSYGASYGAPDAGAQNPDATDPNAPAYNGAAPPDIGGNLYAYPKNGQSPEQQAQDRRECAQWAATQSPDSANGGSMDYKRALTACLSGRGYSVD
jgi:hypothetical protein